MQATAQNVEVKLKLDARIKPLLDTMLKKANLTISDVSDTYLRLWIGQNKDLLTKEERSKFKDLFLYKDE